MARHQITCPIIKSSNDFGYNVPIEYTYYDSIMLNPPAVGNYLSVAFRGNNNPKSRIGIAWDDSNAPKNKNIIKAELYYYGIRGHGDTVFYKYAEFAEGSTIPTHEPADGSVPNGARTGWQVLDLGVPKGNSIILYADLSIYSCPIYNPNGQYVGSTNAYESWQFYSQRNTTNKPYIVITYDDIPPDPPSSLHPSRGTVSTRDTIKFAWMHNSKEDLQQQGFELQYSLNGGSTWTTIRETTSNQFYDMEPNTLPTSGTVTWRVRTWDVEGIESEYKTTTFTLGVLPQKAPIPVSPIGQYVPEDRLIRFEWVFVGGGAGETQSKFDLQYSSDGGNTWVTKTETTNATYYELTPGTFNQGNVAWRIRTYNNWNEVSPWSEDKLFTIIGAPSTPLITNITNTGRPVVSWQATNQHIYELQVIKDGVILYNSGSIPSTTDKMLKLPIYLVDGNYIARLRVYNAYDLSSEWGEKSFEISTHKPPAPHIAVYSGMYGVTITVDNVGLKRLVYRDKELIGVMDDIRYIDYTGESGKEYQYFVRIVDENDNFSDSKVKLARCRFEGSTIAPAESPDRFIKLIYGLDSPPRIVNIIGNEGSLVYYDGRTYPVAEYPCFKTKTKSLSFVLETKRDVDELIKLCKSKETLIYRDEEGIIYGAIFKLDYHKNMLGYYEVGFTINKTDYRGVAYD